VAISIAIAAAAIDFALKSPPQAITDAIALFDSHHPGHITHFAHDIGTQRFTRGRVLSPTSIQLQDSLEEEWRRKS
jgi:hypothetical protein